MLPERREKKKWEEMKKCVRSAPRDDQQEPGLTGHPVITQQHGTKNNIPTTELQGDYTGGIVIISPAPLELAHAHVLKGLYSKRSPQNHSYQ